MKTIKNTFIPILILGSLMAQSRMATVDGYCFLEDSTSHSGVRVLFEAISPSAVTDSAFTSVTGVYSLGLADGIYAVHFSLDGFQPHTLPQNYTFSSSNYSLPDVTLSGGATANVSGYVSGEWFGNTTYMVNGDLTIADGDTLIIYPGTQIKFMGNYTFDIYGSLFAQGVEGDTITFTSGLPVPIAGDWKGIQFFSSSHASVLQYCDIAFGSGSDWEDALVRFYNTSSAPIQILNSKIHTSANHGIYCQSSSPTISGNTIHDNNDNGIFCYESSSPTISGNTIHDNNNGISCYSSSSPTISGNTIHDNNENGIFCWESSSPSIRNNLITTLRSNSNAGIYTGEASQPTIENNIIMGYQSGIYAENLQNAIAFNNMWNNSQNYDGFGLPAEIGNYITTNANGDTCDTYNNISMDPLFVDPARYGNYSWELVGDMLTVYLAVQEDMYDETPTVYVGSAGDCDESITMYWTGEYWTAVLDLSSCSSLEDMYISFDYNAMGLWAGNLNFVTNPNGPVFDPGNRVGADYNLLVNSPCIDAGNPDAAYYDLDGTVADMGAFPYNHGTITAPDVDFTVSASSGQSPFAVQFTYSNSGGAINSYLWSFGDGTSSTTANPVHTFISTSLDTFTVTVSASGPGGSDTQTYTDLIVVSPASFPPLAEFSASPTTGFGLVQFANLSAGEVNSFAWDFGDGSTSTEENPSYTYAAVGTYSVALSVTGPTGTDTETKSDYIQIISPDVVIAGFTVSDTFGVAPKTISFSNTSVGTISGYEWHFDDGDTSFVENPSHTFQSAGVYLVKLIVSGITNNDTLITQIELVSPGVGIVSIEDVSADQGGWVYVNFHASGYDGEQVNRSEVYGIERYEIDHWVNVGSGPAYGSNLYSFLVPTLQDSSSDVNGMTLFRIIASMDEGNYISEVDSGYSVDNIAPGAPISLASSITNDTLVINWEDSGNPDLSYFEVFRDRQLIVQTEESSYQETSTFGDSLIYEIRGVDIHGNAGAFSEELDVNYGLLGDVNWDNSTDVLDVTSAIYMILHESEEAFLNSRLWAADMNADAVIDILDVVQIVDVVMDGALSGLGSNSGTVSLTQSGTTLKITSDMLIAGLQIRLSGAIAVENLSNFSMSQHQDLVILSTLSDQVLVGENISLLELPAGVTVEEIKIADNAGESVESVLSISAPNPIPEKFVLHKNYPNPFNPKTAIRIEMDKAMPLSVIVYNLMGEEVNRIVDQELEAGYYQFIWNGQNVNGDAMASGMYIISAQTPEGIHSIKALLIK